MARSSRAALLAVSAVLVTACTSMPAARSIASDHVAPSRASSAARVHHKLLVILLENHSRQQALQQMPHLTSWARRYGQATDYHAITHPSLPNYLAIFGGSTFGVTDDCSVGSGSCVPAAPSIFARTLDAGRSARAYQESMTSNCQTSSEGDYAARHGPWPYWTNAHERSLCRTHDVPAGSLSHGRLAHDIAAGALPVTGELTPNLCNDGHDCSLSTTDNWLAAWMAKIKSGPDYRNGHLTVVITFDEDDNTSVNKVVFVVVDPRLSHKIVRARCSHYCLARWLATNAGVRPLRHAIRARHLRSEFGL